MSLSDLLIVLSLAFGAWGVGAHLWSIYGPKREVATADERPPRVRNSRRSGRLVPRSRRSNVQNAVNAGSEHQEAVQETVNVQAVNAPGAPPASPAGAADGAVGAFTLSQGELLQLAEALQLRAEGATVEQAICKAFHVTKGGSEGYRRAKALFDAATALPGAAPAGTFADPTAPPRRPGRRRSSSATR